MEAKILTFLTVIVLGSAAQAFMLVSGETLARGEKGSVEPGCVGLAAIVDVTVRAGEPIYVKEGVDGARN